MEQDHSGDKSGSLFPASEHLHLQRQSVKSGTTLSELKRSRGSGSAAEKSSDGVTWSLGADPDPAKAKQEPSEDGGGGGVAAAAWGSLMEKERIPQGPGKYVCPYCGQACTKRNVLQEHIRSHTGERPYPCVSCGVSFKTKSNLYEHNLKSHTHSFPERPYPCVSCGFSFKTKSNLYKHKKSHAHRLKVDLQVQGGDRSSDHESKPKRFSSTECGYFSRSESAATCQSAESSDKILQGMSRGLGQLHVSCLNSDTSMGLPRVNIYVAGLYSSPAPSCLYIRSDGSLVMGEHQEVLAKRMETEVQKEDEMKIEVKNEGEMFQHGSMEHSDLETVCTPLQPLEEKDGVYRRASCEKCQNVQQSYGKERITPEKLSRRRYQVELIGEGTYECVFTGLILEASERVVVRYSVVCWSEFSRFLQKPWMVAGSIFNIETVDKNPSALKSIQLPHFLCLTGQEDEKLFGVLHITGRKPFIEPVQYSGSHLKWLVCGSLCPVGSIAQTSSVECHGAVLIYKDLLSSDEELTLRVYLIPNTSPSHVEAIKKVLPPMRFRRIDKSADCSSTLIPDTKYQLTSDQTGVEIIPKVKMFTLEELVFKGFFEVQYEDPPRTGFKLTLQLKKHLNKNTATKARFKGSKRTGVNEDDEEKIWYTIIRKVDLDNCIEEQPSTSKQVASEKRPPRKKRKVNQQPVDLDNCIEEQPSTLKESDASEKGPPSKTVHQQTGCSNPAKDLLRTKKINLQTILMSESGHVIQCVFEHEAKLLVEREYYCLKSIAESDPVKAATELVDKMMSKGETTCQTFLSLLRDPKLTDMLPDLKNMHW